jgi:hypothetical protein
MYATMTTVIAATNKAKARDAQGNTRRAGRFQRNARRGN